MAISYPRSLPSSRGIRSVRFSMIDAVGVGESPFTFAQEVYEHPGKRWGIEVQLAPMVRADAEAWVAWLASLRGRYGTFLLGDPTGAVAQGSLGGSPVVDGGSQVGQSLSIRGCTNFITDWAVAGDWIQLGTGANARLHKVLANASTDSGGRTTLELWPGPRLGSAPADGDALVTASTVGVWRLAENRRSYDIAEAQVFGISFAAVEAL